MIVTIVNSDLNNELTFKVKFVCPCCDVEVVNFYLLEPGEIKELTFFQADANTISIEVGHD